MTEVQKILNDPDVDSFLSDPMIIQLHKKGDLGKIANLALSLGNIKRNNALRGLSGMVKRLRLTTGEENG